MLTPLLALALTAPFVTDLPLPPGRQETRWSDDGLMRDIADIQKVVDMARVRGTADVVKRLEGINAKTQRELDEKRFERFQSWLPDDPITRKAQAAKLQAATIVLEKALKNVPDRRNGAPLGLSPVPPEYRLPPAEGPPPPRGPRE